MSKETDLRVAESITEIARRYRIDHEGENCGPPVSAAVAAGRYSANYYNISFPCFDNAAHIFAGNIFDGVGISATQKEKSYAHTGCTLIEDGSNRKGENVAGYNGIMILDYDGGHCPREQIHERSCELGLYAATWQTWSDQKQSSKIARSDLERYAGERGLSDETARAYLIDKKGYCPIALGDVHIVGSITESKITVSHGPLSKTRVMIAIKPFMRKDGETTESFKRRWRAYYDAVARLIGIPHDASCASIERYFVGISYNAAWPAPPVPLINRGTVLSHTDPRLNFEQPSATKKASGKKRRPRTNSTYVGRSDGNVSIAELKRALAFIPPDVAYNTWHDCIAIVHYESGGSEEGFALADTWSNGAGCYKAQEMRSKWDYLTTRAATVKDPLGFGSLVLIARRFDPDFLRSSFEERLQQRFRDFEDYNQFCSQVWE